MLATEQSPLDIDEMSGAICSHLNLKDIAAVARTGKMPSAPAWRFPAHVFAMQPVIDRLRVDVSNDRQPFLLPAELAAFEQVVGSSLLSKLDRAILGQLLVVAMIAGPKYIETLLALGANVTARLEPFGLSGAQRAMRGGLNVVRNEVRSILNSKFPIDMPIKFAAARFDAQTIRWLANRLPVDVAAWKCTHTANAPGNNTAPSCSRKWLKLVMIAIQRQNINGLEVFADHPDTLLNDDSEMSPKDAVFGSENEILIVTYLEAMETAELHLTPKGQRAIYGHVPMPYMATVQNQPLVLRKLGQMGVNLDAPIVSDRAIGPKPPKTTLEQTAKDKGFTKIVEVIQEWRKPSATPAPNSTQDKPARRSTAFL